VAEKQGDCPLFSPISMANLIQVKPMTAIYGERGQYLCSGNCEFSCSLFESIALPQGVEFLGPILNKQNGQRRWIFCAFAFFVATDWNSSQC
jgi:hypothetical protein